MRIWFPEIGFKVYGIIRLARPSNVLIAFLSIFVAALISGSLHPLEKVMLACLSGAIITAGANTINDYFDIDIDRINKPHRPLIVGWLTPRAAYGLALFEFALGCILAFQISSVHFAIAFGSCILLYFYSQNLKRQPFWGNFLVSFISALAFIYGGLAVGRGEHAVIPATFAFFYHFGREIIKDIQDIEGDRLAHANTFPIRYGIPKAIYLAKFVFFLLILATILPFALGIYSWRYFLIVLLGVHPVILFTIFRLSESLSFKEWEFLSNLLKADMVVGLLAIFLR